VERGEEHQETALREVKEETGLDGEVVAEIGDISYWFTGVVRPIRQAQSSTVVRRAHHPEEDRGEAHSKSGPEALEGRGSPPRSFDPEALDGGRWRGGDKNAESVKIFKRVYFYLIHYLGGDVSQHDQEVEEVCWLPISEAVKRLSYPTERQTMTKAVALLGSNQGRDGTERGGVKEG
jgi:8-oxo-dGTP pyrophosphatase MutT (NUDIX family)